MECQLFRGRPWIDFVTHCLAWEVLQVVDALIDQRLHGAASMGSTSSSDIVQEVMEEHSVFPFVPGTFPQAR